MNERIFELAQQAENYATTRHPVSNIALSVNNEKFVKKFAELIVRECIAQCEKNKDHEWLGSGSKLSAFNIREHFGVQE